MKAAALVASGALLSLGSLAGAYAGWLLATLGSKEDGARRAVGELVASGAGGVMVLAVLLVVFGTRR